MKPDIETLRKKYIENPPEGMISRDILSMSEEALLDMDYFLNDDELDDDFISSKPVSSISNARLHAGIYYSRERRQAVFHI